LSSHENAKRPVKDRVRLATPVPSQRPSVAHHLPQSYPWLAGHVNGPPDDDDADVLLLSTVDSTLPSLNMGFQSPIRHSQLWQTIVQEVWALLPGGRRIRGWIQRSMASAAEAHWPAWPERGWWGWVLYYKHV